MSLRRLLTGGTGTAWPIFFHGGRPSVFRIRSARFCGVLGLGVLAMAGMVWLILPRPPLLDGVSFSREVFDRHGQPLAVTLSADDKYRLYTPLRDISPELVAATLDYEDRWFGRHPGFNPVALARSAWWCVAGGDRRGGASTITMQLARLRFGLHTRTIPGKLRQIVCALEIERHYSKDEILEAYLNLAPYGGNLEGAGAASLAIFRKPPSALTRFEALALSVIPQSPARRSPLRASDALARSRNVPAVELTQKLHHPGLYDFLQSAGLGLPRPGAWYGLALPLGGAEVRLEDLVRLYAMLANHGVMGDRRLLTPESAFLALEMLGRVPPLDGYAVRAPVYWKTGTSHGYHDAWSVGVCGPYVLAVWAGNFDGRANPALMGRTAAAPLFFQILASLASSGRLPPVPHLPPPGANLRRVELCAESGQLPEAHCPHRIQGWFIPGVSPITTCALHQDVMIDQATGLRLLADDGSRTVRREVFEFWPQDIEKLFAKAGLPRRRPPPFLPGQPNLSAGNGTLKILSPRPGAVFTRRADVTDNAELALRISGNSDSRRVFWFDGAQFLGSCSADQSLRWLPSAGAHQLTAMDQDGRKAEAQIRVEVIGNG